MSQLLQTAHSIFLILALCSLTTAQQGSISPRSWPKTSNEDALSDLSTVHPLLLDEVFAILQHALFNTILTINAATLDPFHPSTRPLDTSTQSATLTSLSHIPQAYDEPSISDFV